MTEIEYGVTLTGFVKKPFSAILDDVTSRIRANLGDDIDFLPHTLIGQTIEAFAYEVALIWDGLEGLYYSGYIDFADGISLDHLIAILLTRRKTATPATGSVMFSRASPGATLSIPAGTRVATSDLTHTYRTTEVADLVDTSVTVPVVAISPGSGGNVAPGTIIRLVDPMSGILEISNPDATTGGADVEVDAALRHRVITYAPSAKATKYSIISAVSRIDGVRAVSLDEDLIENVVTLTIAGGDDGEINVVIDDVRAGGIPASWQRPIPVSIAVTASVSRIPTAEAEVVRSLVEDAITAYLLHLPIGADVIYSDLVRTVLGIPEVSRVSTMTASDGVSAIQQFGERIVIHAGRDAQPGDIQIMVEG